MITLRDVIRSYVPAVEVNGGADDNVRRRPPRPPLDAKRLRKDLERVRTNYAIWFTVAISMAVVAMGTGIVLAFNRVGTTAMPLSVSGLSTCGLLGITARLLKTRGQIDLLLTLAGSLEGDTLQTVIKAIRF